MKIVLKNKILKNLNLNETNSADELIKELSNKEDENPLSIAENIEFENRYAMRKDKQGFLINSEVSVVSTLEELEAKLQNISFQINFIFLFEFKDEQEEQEWSNLEANTVFDKIKPRVEPLIQYEGTEIISYLNGKSGLSNSKTKPIFIEF